MNTIYKMIKHVLQSAPLCRIVTLMQLTLKNAENVKKIYSYTLMGLNLNFALNQFLDVMSIEILLATTTLLFAFLVKMDTIQIQMRVVLKEQWIIVGNMNK